MAGANLLIYISGKKSCLILYALYVYGGCWCSDSKENYCDAMPMGGKRKTGVTWFTG